MIYILLYERRTINYARNHYDYRNFCCYDICYYTGAGIDICNGGCYDKDISSTRCDKGTDNIN